MARRQTVKRSTAHVMFICSVYRVYQHATNNIKIKAKQKIPKNIKTKWWRMLYIDKIPTNRQHCIWARGQYDKYLALPTDSADTIARAVYYPILYPCTIAWTFTVKMSVESDSEFCFDRVWKRSHLWISKEKMKKSNIGRFRWFDFCFCKGNRAVKSMSALYGDSSPSMYFDEK